MREKFDIDRMILGLFIKLKKDVINLSDFNERSRVWKQIQAIPNTREEKQVLADEFQLQCDIHDHGYVCNIDKIKIV